MQHETTKAVQMYTCGANGGPAARASKKMEPRTQATNQQTRKTRQTIQRRTSDMNDAVANFLDTQRLG